MHGCEIPSAFAACWGEVLCGFLVVGGWGDGSVVGFQGLGCEEER
jgi:hypothetical protein